MKRKLSKPLPGSAGAAAAVFAGLLFFFSSFPVSAEQEFALSLAPVFRLPVGQENFSSSLGAEAVLDWAFLPFMGISAAGGFSGLSVADGSSLTLIEGGGGIFFRWRPLDRWTFRGDLRAGAYQYRWEDYSSTRPFAGAGLAADFHLSPYIALYAGGGFTWRAFSRSHLSTVNLGAGLRLKLSELMARRSRVAGEKIEQHRVFPVSYAWYRDNPVATVRITNNEPNAITQVRLSFFMERYMGQPEFFAEIPALAPGESIEVPVTALFNEGMLDLTENVNAGGVILINYRSLGARKKAEIPVQMPVFHRNAMSWDDDRRAASFVSPRDPAARTFARYTASAVDRLPDTGLPRNVRYAAALFEALGLYGINYVIDPASSFIEMSGDSSALDSLNYPYQTLHYRGGDCDDLAILYCSLLEVLGVDTAFITIPGHIFMAFDTGDSQWQKDGLIEYAGRFWMPVEITLPAEGFYQAWRVGARQWRTAGGEARLYPLAESWAIYPSVTVPAAGDKLPLMPGEADIAGRFTRAAARVGAGR